MNKYLTIILFFWFTASFAAPYNGNSMMFKQPDGSMVEVKLYGTEYYMRGESPDGYTLVKDAQTGWICYASLSSDGRELLSTGVQYKGAKAEVPMPAGISKHLDISGKAREEVILKKKHELGDWQGLQASKTEFHPVVGNIKGLCVVIDFSDEPGTLPISEFFDFCNNMNYSNFGNNGSLRSYYSDMSGGLVDYENVVYGYYRAPLTFAEYDAMPYSQGAKQVLNLALNWIDSQGFDFSTLSTNPDGSIQAINLMYTGNPAGWAQGMWWHMGNFSGFSADGVHSGPYNCSPANSPLTIATVCHENGHMIGKWPDTYKYNSTTGPDGIGSFDLMCWYGDSYNPVPPNPHFRTNATWGQVIDVTYYNGLMHDTANSFTVCKYRNVNDTNEFFLLENRKQEGRSLAIADEGLTIWHIDRNGDNQTTHHEVYLVHANNDIQNHMQACFHQGFNQEYGINTTPNSLLFNGNPSGLRVWEIGPQADIMTYKLGAGVAAPTFQLTFINISGDNNGNGFLEPAETGMVNISVGNYGQVNSAVATTTCTAIGPNAGLITINTAPVNIGTVAVNALLPAAFNVSLNPSAQIGTEIELKFEVSDGVYSTYITKKLILGREVIINNQQDTTCSAIFYDHGGPYGNYINMTDYSATFFPETLTQAISAHFLSFDLEEEPNCIYDYLKIYNGPDANAALIGMYCGTNSPGTVVSTHPSGALTFVFHADEGVTGSGWSAVLSCTPGSGISGPEGQAFVSVYPNPSKGIFTIYAPGNQLSEIIVEDLTGRTLVHADNIHENHVAIDLSGYPEGLYFLRVLTPGNSISQKLILGK